MTDAQRILQILLKDFHQGDKSGLYGLTQTALAYNSNHLEGSTLTAEQTAFLFDTGTIGGDGAFYRSKDVEEAQGHFLMFNEMLKTMDNPLSESLIKRFHYCLKAGVFEDRTNGYAIGDYKKRPNRVGVITTVLPDEVAPRMQALLEHYNGMARHGYEELAAFHVEYERIHPFQDGNGRTGRLLLFRECLRNDLIPFIIRDHNNLRYKKALGTAQQTGDYGNLTDILREEQTWYRNAALPYLEAPLRSEKRGEER